MVLKTKLETSFTKIPDEVFFPSMHQPIFISSYSFSQWEARMINRRIQDYWSYTLAAKTTTLFLQEKELLCRKRQHSIMTRTNLRNRGYLECRTNYVNCWRKIFVKDFMTGKFQESILNMNLCLYNVLNFLQLKTMIKNIRAKIKYF